MGQSCHDLKKQLNSGIAPEDNPGNRPEASNGLANLDKPEAMA